MDHQSEIILDMLGTIRRLEANYLIEPDPRVRLEIAETLDILNVSFDREVKRYIKEAKQDKAS